MFKTIKLQRNIILILYLKLTYALLLYTLRGSRDISDISPSHPLYGNDIALRKPPDVTGGKPIIV
jgi:hypothetical protein